MVMANDGQLNATSAKITKSYPIEYLGALCHYVKPTGLKGVDCVGHCLWQLIA